MKKSRNLLFLLVLASCGNFVTRKELEASKKSQPKSKIEILTSVANQASEDQLQLAENIELNKEIESNEDDDMRSDTITLTKSSISSKNSNDGIKNLNLEYKKKHYDFWMKYFSSKDKERFERHLANGVEVRDIVFKILESHGLPTDLFYVGLIESGYNTHIRSRAEAVGPWQFIKGTATRYGLRVDNQVDERSHIIKSTHAAASYFKDLYNIFGSWELALCAYNAGEYRIINAIRKGNTRDYKELVSLKLIPKETIYYIPKVAAARELFENNQKYGIKINKPQRPMFDKVEEFYVRKSFDLYDTARELNISYATLKSLNPDLRQRWIKVHSRKKQTIFIPSHGFTHFSNKVEEEEVVRVVTSKNEKKIYKVKRGDNLTTISKRLGVDLLTLKKINGIKGNKILVGQKLNYHTALEKVSSIEVAAPKVDSKETMNSSKNEAHFSYSVKRGDNLNTIANIFNVSVNTLKKVNNLQKTKIFVGQNLRIPASVETYKVKKGDNLFQISKKFGVKISTLKKINDLDSNIVFYGQVLTIPNNEG